MRSARDRLEKKLNFLKKDRESIMEKNYRYELTALYGDPVDENPVGVMMEAGYQELGLNYRYLNMHVKMRRSWKMLLRQFGHWESRA